jgi:hypothetical protein
MNTWLFFTDYLAFYRADAISNHLFWQYVKTNIRFVLYQLGAYFIELRHFHPAPLAITVLFILVCLVVLRGLLRQVQIGGWHPAHFALAFYLIPVLIWDYSSPERFLIPFLPLIGAAVWVECRNLSREIRVAFQKQETVKGWIAAAVFVLVAAAVMLSAGVSWRREIRAIADTSERREALLTDKRDAYSWLRDNSPPDARIIAYEAASAYLYSDRQGMQPAILSQAGKDRPDILNSELSCLFSGSDAIGAQYLVVSDDDFRLDWNYAAEQEKSIEAKMESTMKPVFRSPFGHVRIYSARTGIR